MLNYSLYIDSLSFDETIVLLIKFGDLHLIIIIVFLLFAFFCLFVCFVFCKTCFIDIINCLKVPREFYKIQMVYFL